MKLPTQRFEAVHVTPTVPTNSQENFNNGLGPGRLHHLQGARVWHLHVLRHQVAPRPREEGERRGSAAARGGGAEAWHGGVGCGRGRSVQARSALERMCKAQRFWWWTTAILYSFAHHTLQVLIAVVHRCSMIQSVLAAMPHCYHERHESYFTRYSAR